MAKQVKNYGHTRLRSLARHKLVRKLENGLRAARSVLDFPAYHLSKKVEKIAAQSTEALAKFERAIGPRADYIIPAWYDFNFWEPSVLLALRDLCRPGDVVFDVGANAGAMTVPMSRLVGPRGIVFAFEASRRIIDKTQFNVVQAGCGNVQIFHRAVYRETGVFLPIFEGSHLNDSIYAAGGTASAACVKSVALDDFAAHWSVKPSVIKMDIEGAEFDAIMGAQGLIRDARSHLILEQSPGDTRCLDWLLNAGYVAIDLASYRKVAGASDFEAGVGVMNVLFIHKDRLAQTPYATMQAPELVLELDHSGLQDIRLEAGRYAIEALMSARRSDNDMMAGVECEGGLLARYHTNSKFLAESYRLFPFHLEKATSVRFFARFLNGTSDPTFELNGARVWRIPGEFCTPNFVV